MADQQQRERISRLVRRLGLPQDAIVRDLIQARLMSSVFSRDIAARLAIKGGFAMRMYAQTKRPTKDIDLQADPKMPMGTVAGIIREGIDAALGSGLLEDITITEPKQTETVQRWKINGRVAGGESNVHLTVEVSRRGMPSDDLLLRRDFVPQPAAGALPSVVTVYSPAMMLVSKMAALASPNRIAARDVWDINELFDVMIEMRIEPPIALIAEFGAERLVQLQQAIDDKLDAMPWPVAKEQIVPLLPRKLAATFDEHAWAAMCVRASVQLGDWIEEARMRATGIAGVAA